jgi:hypothetical protein
MSSSAFTPSTTTVTNNVPVNVPVVTAWEAYTPTYTGFGTVTSSEMFWRRNGDQLEVRGNFTTGTTTAVEARLSFPDATTTASAFPSIRIAGSAIRAGSSATFFSDNVLSEPSVSYFTFGVQASTSSGLTKVLGSGFAATTKETISASTSISQWAGSGTTTLATRAVEEYAWNSDPGVAAGTNYSNSVYYGNGPSGTPFVAVNSTTTTGYNRTGYYVKFQTPILPTDNLFLEISTDGGLSWSNAAPNETQVFFIGGSSVYGMSIIDKVDSTTLRIGFGNAGRRPDATFGGVGAAWSSISGSTYRWRVRKVSSGSQIGYPVSARNIVGDTSGTVVPVGMLGEELTSTSGSAVALTNNTFATIASIILTAGTWDISAFGTWQNTATQATGNQTMNMAISTAPASSTGATAGLNYAELYGVSAKSGYAGVTLSIPPNRVIVSSNTQRFLCIRFFADAAGSGNQAIGTIRAVRIA